MNNAAMGNVAMNDAPVAAPRSRQALGLLLVAVPVALAVWLVIYPALVAVVGTWRVEAGDGVAWSVANYSRFFNDPYSLANLQLTVWVTAVTCLLATGLCLPIALYLRFSTGPLAGLVQALALMPLFVPSIILAFAFIRTLGPHGMLDTLLLAAGLPKLPSPYLTPWGPVIGLVWDMMPMTLLLLLAGLGNVPKAAVEAARDVGAGAWALLVHIVLPRIRATLLVTLSFNVLSAFAAFTLPYLLGPAAPEMMGPFMQRTFGDVQDVAAAQTQAVISFAICAVFGALYVASIAQGRRSGTS